MLYRHWNKELINRTPKRHQNERRLYWRCIVSFIQIQGGFSPDESPTMRLKTEFPLYYLFGKEYRSDEQNRVIDKITFSAYFETNFQQQNIIGISMGYPLFN